MIAISTGPYTHLDHLAPLCEEMDIPCIVTDEKAFSIGQRFYPQIQLKLIAPSELTLDFLSKWEAIITCGKFWAMDLVPLLKLQKKTLPRFIFAPHGYSDKEGRGAQETVFQDISLCYGKKHEEELEKRGALQIWQIGNPRLALYQKYQSHFDRLVEKQISFKKGKKTLLYAPTWETRASSTSFKKQTLEMIHTLSQTFHVLVKPHPLLEDADPVAYYYLQGKCAPGTFIEDFPAIYPLLSKVDMYLGDFSSIGYDFLYFDRPLFFLGEGSSKDLIRNCGKPAGDFTDEQKELSPIRKALYQQVFSGSKKPHFKEKMGLKR